MSHRPGDAPAHVGRLIDWLHTQVDPSQVFSDVQPAESGGDVVQAVKEVVASCDVVLVVIGDGWLNGRDGSNPLENAEDSVRLEVETAFDADIKVVPILIEDAEMPTSRQLPPSLDRLARQGPIRLSDASWRDDLKHVVEALRSTTRVGGLWARVKRSRLRGPAGRAGTAATTIASIARTGRGLAVIATIVIAVVSGISLFNRSTDDDPKYKSVKDALGRVHFGVPTDWSVDRRAGSLLLFPVTDEVARFEVRSANSRGVASSREYALAVGDSYRRSLDGYRELELRPTQTWPDSYQRVFIFNADDEQHLFGGVEMYHASGKQRTRATIRSELGSPVEEHLGRLRQLISSVRFDASQADR